MKLADKYAMVCGAGVFMLICYTRVFSTFSPLDMLKQINQGVPVVMDPMPLLQMLGWAFTGGGVAGFFGYQIGAVMGNPKGNAPGKQSKSRRQLAEEKLLAELEKAEAQGLGQVAENAFAEMPQQEEANNPE